jgi:DNA-binding PadR family transcriptional regulator
MKASGWLESSWGETDTNRRAKYYRLTTAGRRQLREETREWSLISAAITMALSTA